MDIATLRSAEHRLAELPLDLLPELTGVLPPGSRMPFSHNPHFVGRVDEMLALAGMLKGGATAAIGPLAATGLGGVGKTQLAVEVVHRYGQFFTGGVFWLNFADANNVPAEVAACGSTDHLGLWPTITGIEPPSISEQIALVRRAWNLALPRLLIFDSCEDEDLFQQWRPTSGGCRVIITSRRAYWESTFGVQRLAIGILPNPTSIALLRKHRPDLAVDDPVLAAIAAEVGHLPLALHLAGSFLARYQAILSPMSYLVELSSPALLQHRSFKGAGFSPTNHEPNVARTFAVSYKRLNAANATDAVALALLARSAYFAAGESIPRALLCATLASKEFDGTSAVLIEDALLRLIELGLLERAAGTGLRLHRLLGLFVREHMVEYDAQQAVELTLNTVATALNSQGDPRLLVEWQSHLRAITDAALDRLDDAAAALADTFAYHLRIIGDYSGARGYLERAMAIRMSVQGGQHPQTASTINNLGVVLAFLGDYSGARRYFEQALVVNQTVLGQQHPDTASSLNTMGVILRDQGDHVGARRYLEQALAIRMSVLGEHDPDTVLSSNNLGAVLRDQGDYVEARRCFEQALAVNQAVLGQEHPHTATSFNNLGAVLRDQGDYVEARRCFEQALAINQVVLGEEHPHTASTLNNLGGLLQDQRDYAEAGRYLEQALAIRLTVFGEHHPQTALSFNNLALLQFYAGCIPEAIALMQRALTTREAVLGVNHPDTESSRIALRQMTSKVQGFRAQWQIRPSLLQELMKWLRELAAWWSK